MANIAAMNSLFLLQYHDRLAQQTRQSLANGETHGALWLRQTGGRDRNIDLSGQLTTRGNSYVTQLGSDLLTFSHGESAFTVGAFAGYGHHRNHTRASLTGYRSRGQVNGYSLGLYGSWLNNGAYIDSWLQHTWFNGSVKGDELENQVYKAKGYLASIESGYAMRAGAVTLTPKAQLAWLGVKADTFTDSQGTRVKSKGDGSLLTRLGARVALTEGSLVTPYIEANWRHHTQPFAVQMGTGENQPSGARNLAEVKLGGEARLAQRLTGSVDVTHAAGPDGYQEASGRRDLSWTF